MEEVWNEKKLHGYLSSLLCGVQRLSARMAVLSAADNSSVTTSYLIHTHTHTHTHRRRHAHTHAPTHTHSQMRCAADYKLRSQCRWVSLAATSLSLSLSLPRARCSPCVGEREAAPSSLPYQGPVTPRGRAKGGLNRDIRLRSAPFSENTLCHHLFIVSILLQSGWVVTWIVASRRVS